MSHVVADALRERNEDVIIVESKEERAEVLREQGFNVVVGDVTSEEVLSEAGVEKAIMAYVLTLDDDVNAAAVRAIRSLNPTAYVIARVSDEERVDDMHELGADEVLSPNQLLVEKLLYNIETVEVRRKIHELFNVLRDLETLAIVPHDNPDPDAIASALALAELASHLGVNAEIVYGGEIGHQENKAMVNLLDIEMEKVSSVDLDSYDGFAVVDTPVLPKHLEGREEDVVAVFDHHESSDVMDNNGKISALEVADFTDHRPDVGSTSTIMTQYAKLVDDFELSRKTATALLYGIRTDTMNFTRNASPDDLKAAAYLYPRADHEVLAKIESPDISPETLDVLGEAIRNRTVIRSYLFSNAGYVKNADALPQAADYLLNLEGVNTAIVFGIVDGKIKISARTEDIRVNVGEIMKEAFGDVGSAGGHSKAAAAEIPLGIFRDVEDEIVLDLVEDAVKKRLFKVLGIEEKD